MPIQYLPTIDSPAHAAHVKAVLDIPRHTAREVAASTMAILEQQGYTAPNGTHVDLRAALQRERANKVSLAPHDPLDAVKAQFAQGAAPAPAATTKVWIANETTLMAAHRIALMGHRPLVLNFANGATPGGGFLNGARAQEESLCFASTLYASLVGDRMYDIHRQRTTYDSSAHLIVSTATVIRDDHHTLLDAPWEMDVITGAAPVCNSTNYYSKTHVSPAKGAALMHERIHRVLDVAAAAGATHLVLGAWGCGAFHNDPTAIAHSFHTALEARAGVFAEAVFAIADWSNERRFIRPFAKTLS